MSPPFPEPRRADAESVELAVGAARAADAKGGSDVVVLDVASVSTFCDVFVIASGRSDRQVRTMAEEVEAELRRGWDRSPLRVEGLDHGQWVVLDYGDVVVHLFDLPTRDYYTLERLWADGVRRAWVPAPVRS